MEKQADRMMLDSHIHVILTEVSDGTGPATGKHQTPAINKHLHEDLQELSQIPHG